MYRVTLLLFALFLLAPPQCLVSQEFKVVSFNIRYGTPADGENTWKFRRKRVFKIFDEYKDDIIATQEALPLQIDEILYEFPELEVVYRSRTLEHEDGEGNAVFFNKSKWTLVSHDTFWLSDTPEEPASKSWGNTLPRISTLVVLRNISSGKRLKLMNVHFDHRSENSRTRSTELVMRKLLTEAETMPTILLGDINEPPEERNVKRINKFFEDTYKGSELEGCTYHDYNGGILCPRIDYIFYDKSSGLALKSFLINRWQDKYYFPSDHYPLVATFAFE